MSDRKIEDFFTPTHSTKRHRPYTSPGSAEQQLGSAMEKVGDLTLSQLSQLLDDKLSKLATKEDISALAQKVQSLEEENSALKEVVHRLERQGRDMAAKLVDLEGRSRRNNLIFKGMNVNDKTTDFKHVVSKFCSDVLGADNKLWVNRAHPLGRDRSTLIAHFPDDSDVQYVMSRVKNLKGTGYVVHRDYPREVREKRARLMEVRAEVERVTGRRRMPLMFDHLTIEGVRFTWEDGKLTAGRQDGVQRLNNLLGKDFSAFFQRRQQGSGGTPTSAAPSVTPAGSVGGTTAEAATGVSGQ